jgi:ligand-binding sensor domain-containing protein/signal transduction histidine kinase
MPKKRWALQFAGLALCAFAAAFSARAAPAAGTDTPFIVASWDNESGLPDSEVISVIQTRDGYLWLGTLHGLVRFDGSRFAIFNKQNTPGLNSDRIVFLFEDNETNLWVGTESSGLAVIQDGTIKTITCDNGDSVGKVVYAYEDAMTNVWFYTEDRRSFRYHDGRMESVVSTQLLLRAARIEIPGKSNSWRIVNGTVQEWRSDRPSRIFGPCPWDNRVVTAACEDTDGNLIVGTLGAGIFWYEPDGKYHHIGADEGLSSAYVLSLCMDREGDLWAGTDGGGLDRIKRKIFTELPGLHPWAAQSVSADANGGLWVAFGALGASCWNTNSARDYHVGPHQAAWEMLVDPRQRVWAGTRDDGLFVLGPDGFQPAPGAALLGPQIYALFEDRAGRLWAGTQKGLADFDGANWKLFTTRDGLSENMVRAIAEDRDGNLWIGTESGGLDAFSAGKFTSYRAGTNGLPGDDISCLYADKDDALWVGTSGHGLARFQSGKWSRYSTANGLASDSISYIIEDDAGVLWIGSNAGLMRISKKSLADFASGAASVISCRTYGKADGLPTRECSAGSQPAAIRAGGRLWFPTTRGLASVNPADIKPNLQPPLVKIESALVDGREQKTNRLDSAWGQSITLPPGYEQLDIGYTALNFSAPEQVRFKYWLEGHEAKPMDVGGERIARYPKLPPGDYRFHVTACNEDGIWNGTGSTLDIIVLPQFWQTRTFRLAAIILILGIVAASVRYISTQKLQRQLQSLQQREALERERARIARDLHDQIGANLTQVALLGEMAESDKDSPEEIGSHARQISQTARETTGALDEIVWAINPANDTLEGLANYACKHAQEYFALAGLRCRADVPSQLPAVPIPPDVRHNVFLAFKEAVHNVVKHAQATEARIRLRLEPDKFILEIEDDGRGLGSQAAPQNRNGLRNMKKRMEDIHGEFWIGAAAEKGTIVRLTAPIK